MKLITLQGWLCSSYLSSYENRRNCKDPTCYMSLIILVPMEMTSMDSIR
uniref:Uncharacterized protein n=1 Tax=Arundo donax TaxID=35708 RepID=A0A0A9ARN6_ARUDO